MEQSLFGYYLLPEDAQLRLLQTRDHLRFLATLAQPGATIASHFNEPHVSLNALAFCFDLLAEQLENVLNQTLTPDDFLGPNLTQ
ncbi:XAC0095 family protein [Xanthomonas hortorum]|uniref:XAC0095 family protein n=1 Tax=Xanthomonas hortorum TaxID=56454 RepID=UPI0015D59D54|nr:hypothetical protein [Xanthomonas hortorum]MCE4356746.1 hypothetical protein [Xanthomonas hortorum pv. taraxaci]NMI51114.1 hypothetical protein [Xanthomonas hortorum pv. taraxaci]CAD0358693.1 hypothetical protein NCPPB940_43060 [Xanthomonas hortorum pv. taraxaci]CAD0358699.1 hypothetical protein NCPPB940_43060 [Xanthomonas hortorum pv. taraxaci]